MKTKQNKTGMTRRRFIASSALATFGFQVVPSRVFGANSRLAVAGIGSGGKGRADITGAAKAGADISTVPYKVLTQMVNHPLTDAGVARFLADWEKAKGG